jgi:hypothetical protein
MRSWLFCAKLAIVVLLLQVATTLDAQNPTVTALSNFNSSFVVNASSLISYQNKIYFIGSQSSGGKTTPQLWCMNYDGSGLTQVTSLTNTGVVQLLVFNEKIYFSTPAAAVDTYNLWVSDGTASGTYQFNAFPVDQNSFTPGNCVINNNRLIYTCSYPAGSSGARIYLTDGTSGGTKILGQFDYHQTVNLS